MEAATPPSPPIRSTALHYTSGCLPSLQNIHILSSVLSRCNAPGFNLIETGHIPSVDTQGRVLLSSAGPPRYNNHRIGGERASIFSDRVPTRCFHKDRAYSYKEFPPGRSRDAHDCASNCPLRSHPDSLRSDAGSAGRPALAAPAITQNPVAAIAVDTAS